MVVIHKKFIVTRSKLLRESLFYHHLLLASVFKGNTDNEEVHLLFREPLFYHHLLPSSVFEGNTDNREVHFLVTVTHSTLEIIYHFVGSMCSRSDCIFEMSRIRYPTL